MSITAADADRSKAALSPFNAHKSGRTTLSSSGKAAMFEVSLLGQCVRHALE